MNLRLITLLTLLRVIICLTDIEQYNELMICLGDEAAKYNITLGGNFKVTVTPKTDRQLNAVDYDQRLFNCTFIYMRGRLSSDTGPWGEETNDYRDRISEKIRNVEIPLGKYPEQYKRNTCGPVNLKKIYAFIAQANGSKENTICGHRQNRINWLTGISSLNV